MTTTEADTSIVWEFTTKDPHGLDFCCKGTESEAKELLQVLAGRDVEYSYSARESDFPRIADILTDISVSDAMANDN
jgi:hypothetical protein